MSHIRIVDGQPDLYRSDNGPILNMKDYYPYETDIVAAGSKSVEWKPEGNFILEGWSISTGKTPAKDQLKTVRLLVQEAEYAYTTLEQAEPKLGPLKACACVMLWSILIVTEHCRPMEVAEILKRSAVEPNYLLLGSKVVVEFDGLSEGMHVHLRGKLRKPLTR